MTLEAAHPPRSPALRFDELTPDEYRVYRDQCGDVKTNDGRILNVSNVRQNRRRPYPQHLVTIDMLEDMIV
ncbi:hypothetical protein F2Q70_00021730 [Brassica cretica]|uniref:Uncharacterized protein n=2 Tax=Brassica cretica TaxID=69181 RepID=A0A8S9HKM5_BRACR|nr:hypothetical protein F2Q70_00021730 [Brassica cretica]KAF2558483.1 hypothetical protein F2Q68_00015419 [Brassica cretica]KAF3608352.1 hypothetical protein DY000_02048054 [Brassica cretica]